MQQLFGPALEAELAYRRERAALAYTTPTLWSRWRARRERRRRLRAGEPLPRPRATDVQRAEQIRAALEALRPAPGQYPRAA